MSNRWAENAMLALHAALLSFQETASSSANHVKRNLGFVEIAFNSSCK
jgi:hypothetical protein